MCALRRLDTGTLVKVECTDNDYHDKDGPAQGIIGISTSIDDAELSEHFLENPEISSGSPMNGPFEVTCPHCFKLMEIDAEGMTHESFFVDCVSCAREFEVTL